MGRWKWNAYILYTISIKLIFLFYMHCPNRITILRIVEKDQSTFPDDERSISRKIAKRKYTWPSKPRYKSSNYVCNWIDKPKCFQIFRIVFHIIIGGLSIIFFHNFFCNVNFRITVMVQRNLRNSHQRKIVYLCKSMMIETKKSRLVYSRDFHDLQCYTLTLSACNILFLLTLKLIEVIFYIFSNFKFLWRALYLDSELQ